MNRVSEWGLALILGVGSATGCTQEKSPEVNDYTIALDWKEKALAEYDEEIRRSNLEKALKQFQNAREHGTKPLDSLLHEAEIHSMLGDPITALKLADKVIEKDPVAIAYFSKGQIEKRHGYFAYAVRSFTKSLELEERPETRWARSESYMGIAVTRNGIIQKPVENAKEDINKYIEMRPEEPDGYLLKVGIQCMLAKAKYDKPHDEEAFEALKYAFEELIYKGKQIKRELIKNNKDMLERQYNELKKEYEPKEEPKEVPKQEPKRMPREYF